MKSDTTKFTLRTDPVLLKKFHSVADYNGRSANRELEVLIKRHVAEFENIHGKITPEWPFPLQQGIISVCALGNQCITL